ncbi:MAG: cation-transporting P-type ATPase [Halobacteriovoraceae bacterium]|nr:cation-transporting P-type ATPase [Halobacteriovoraceae bacterium]MCB9095344.1 cation-transporting P-type ATPase [Halobacteriovoraceae bacterium]
MSVQSKIEKKGLSHKEAQTRLIKYGRNEVVPSALNSKLSEFFKFFKDPMGLMMLALAGIYFLLGETRDAIVMLIAFIPVSAVDVFLELKAQRALRALKATFQVTAKVFRDGELVEISIQEIVPGDWIALEEGQTIPADGNMITTSNLSVSESALTGESFPIEKIDSDEVYAGTSILTGRGIVEIKTTGRNTKFGKIVELLEGTNEGGSPLQKKVRQLVVQIMRIAALLVICLFILELIRGKSPLRSLLISLTFGMASVPEEFPLVFTLYLSLGAWRLAKNGVLVKSLPSVETLGSVNVICTDKTGTLTEGKFQMNELISFSDMPINDQWALAVLACEPVVVDSMELAIKQKAPTEIEAKHWTLIYDYPFEAEGKHMAHAWQNEHGEGIVAMKGAVEGVLEHCCDSKELKEQVRLKTELLSSQGYRLLGLAAKKGAIVGSREKDEEAMSFIAIMTFSDPIRDSAKKALAICQSQKIKVKMITGDHPFTAHAIADQLELEHSHDALYTGADLNLLSESERLKAFKKGAIFSRVTPEQKYELVRALKNDGMVVAMTGDGVNDTPAMKISDIGISMGENATDAARATAKMILIKNDFNGIVYAITEGRRIFSNLRKSFSYLISFHVPVILLSFLPPLLKLGEFLMPIHIILLELVVHPVSAFTFENFQSGSLRVDEGILNKMMLLSSILAGVIVSLTALFLFVMAKGIPLEERRTIALSTVLFGNMGFILLETWPLFTKRLWVTLSLLFFVTIASFEIPIVASYLHLLAPPYHWIGYSFVIGVISSWPSWFVRKKFVSKLK